MTSYQRRLEDIKWHKQRERDLEKLIKEAMRTLVMEHPGTKLPAWVFPGFIVNGDDFLNDVNLGDFMRKLIIEINPLIRIV